MKEAIAGILLMCSCLWVNGQENAETFIRMHPSVLTFDGGSGVSQTKSVYIVNEKQKPYRFKAILKDWTRDSSGYHMFFQQGSHPNSCAGWISIDSNYFDILPGNKARIDVTMTAPKNVKVEDMKWTMLFFEFWDTSATKIGSKSQYRLGTHIYYTPPSLDKTADVDLLTLSVNHRSEECRIVAANNGKTQERCDIVLELRSAQGKDKIVLRQDDIAILPDHKRNIDFHIPDSIVPGKYNATATVFRNGEQTQLGKIEKKIEVK